MSERASEGQLIEACRQEIRSVQAIVSVIQLPSVVIALHFTGDRTAASDITQQSLPQAVYEHRAIPA